MSVRSSYVGRATTAGRMTRLLTSAAAAYPIDTHDNARLDTDCDKKILILFLVYALVPYIIIVIKYTGVLSFIECLLIICFTNNKFLLKTFCLLYRLRFEV